MPVVVLGIDLGKTSCRAVGLDEAGRVVLRRRMRHETVIALAAELPACVAAMEACCGAHHMGRAQAAQGREVGAAHVAEYVRLYVMTQKNDDHDAEAIAQAATGPSMRFVAPKSAEQFDVQKMHRVRDRLVAERTSLMNQTGKLLLERDTVVPQACAKLNEKLVDLCQEPDQVSLRIRLLLTDLHEWLLGIAAHIRAYGADSSLKRSPTSGRAVS